MAKLKTTENDHKVEAFLQSVEEKRRKDCEMLIAIIKKITKFEPKMWGTAIIGFGSYHYKYDSGHEGDAALVGLSPRKQNITMYLMPGFEGQEKILKRLGKHKTGKACLYINKLEDINIDVLIELIEVSVDSLKKMYGSKK